MANLQSSKKRARQNVKLRMHNKVIKSAMRTQVKKFLAAMNAKDAQLASMELGKTMSCLDKIAQKQIFHRNNVSRTKSKLQLKYNEFLAQEKAGTTAEN
ncbi:MAG: 30S ribosomal protein S20 [Candidatus Brocadiae bacterium]|nr:30S ribosomal protein S20 [Candidatus Brocadiia bacterium]